MNLLLKMVWVTVICVVLYSCSLSCEHSEHKVHESHDSEALHFLASKNYIYSTNSESIPGIVEQGIADFNQAEFYIYDTSVAHMDSSRFRISDAYTRTLRFFIRNDSLCLLSYTEGGIGTHSVIDFVKYKGGFRLTRYTPTDDIDDTIKLARVLTYYGKPDTVWARPAAQELAH